MGDEDLIFFNLLRRCMHCCFMVNGEWCSVKTFERADVAMWAGMLAKRDAESFILRVWHFIPLWLPLLSVCMMSVIILLVNADD
jgi:hypothetical protein